MRQQLLVSANKHPWLLPALGLALFVHRHFLPFDRQLSTPARLRPGTRCKPPKLKRKHKQQQATPQEAAVDVDAERLDASGLAHDRLMECFTEDEVEALHQAQTNPSALISLLRGNRFANMEADEASSQWSTDDEDSRQGLHTLSIQPLQLLHDSLQDNLLAGDASAMSTASAEANQPQQQQQGDVQQSQLLQELLPQIASAQQQLAQQQQQQQQSALAYAQPAAGTCNSLTTTLAGQDPALAAAAMQQSASISEYDFEDDNFDYAADSGDPNHYYAPSPAAVAPAGPPSTSPGHFLPGAGGLWAGSYACRFREDLQLAGAGEEAHQLGVADPAGAHLSGAGVADALAVDLAAGMEPPFPDWEPDLGDWDLDAPEFDPVFDYDPGFDYDEFGLDFDEELCRAALAAMAPAVQA